MRKMSGLAFAIAAGVLSLLAGTQPASAQPYYALEYYGGPILETFTVYPLYFGNPSGPGAWSAALIGQQQTYLTHLVDYISGVNAPANQQPMLRQYGVFEAKLHPPAEATAPSTPSNPCYSSTASAYPTTLTHSDIICIIKANQAAGTLPPFGDHTVIALFLAPGFFAAPCGTAGCHQSEAVGQYWLAVPLVFDSMGHYDIFGFQVTSAHEVFESATDPAVNGPPPVCSLPPCGPVAPTTWGWLSDQYMGSSGVGADEAIDECGNFFFITLPNLGGISIPEAIDNTLGTHIPTPPGVAVEGACNTTGYTSTEEQAVYGLTLAQYLSQYSTAKSKGMRLYTLQAYVTIPKGDILYNAVWRPGGNTDEEADYGVTFAKLQSDDLLYSGEGYRLYILQSYVLPPSAGPLADEVRYNAVWRPGLFNYAADYGVIFSQYATDQAAHSAASDNLYIFQPYVQNAIFMFYNALWRPGISAEQAHYAISGPQLKSLNNTLSSSGWRLYLLQSYVVGSGAPEYDAIWRPGNHAEISIHDATFATYMTEYNNLSAQGYRLYILDTVVLSTGDVLYNAIWQKGTVDRPL